MNRAPIGLFDSGFGGLTVLRELLRELPFEDVIYLGDTAHLPYGNKSPETVRKLAFDNSKFLVASGVKLLLVACHTACSHALSSLQKALPIPVLGVVEPGIHELTRGTRSRRVAVLGTASTIASGLYQSRLQMLDVLAIACPLFVPLIEEGFHNHMAAECVARDYLKPVLDHKSDAVLLACTHYPLMRPILTKVLGEKVFLAEPAKRCAEEVKQHLLQHNLLNPQREIPNRVFYTTDAPEKFQQLGAIFLGEPIGKIELKKTALSERIFSGKGASNESEKADFTC